LADGLTFSLDELRYEYPSELTNGETAPARLARLTESGLNWRYPEGVPAKARAQVAHELKLINKMGYEPYFLTVHDIVAFARERGILCQGRGSAANSVVCYALGVTSVSPEIGTMVFERFISEARGEPPEDAVELGRWSGSTAQDADLEPALRAHRCHRLRVGTLPDRHAQGGKRPRLDYPRKLLLVGGSLTAVGSDRDAEGHDEVWAPGDFFPPAAISGSFLQLAFRKRGSLGESDGSIHRAFPINLLNH
jgi:hypothetical protein